MERNESGGEIPRRMFSRKRMKNAGRLVAMYARLSAERPSRQPRLAQSRLDLARMFRDRWGDGRRTERMLLGALEAYDRCAGSERTSITRIGVLKELDALYSRTGRLERCERMRLRILEAYRFMPRTDRSPSGGWATCMSTWNVSARRSACTRRRWKRARSSTARTNTGIGPERLSVSGVSAGYTSFACTTIPLPKRATGNRSKCCVRCARTDMSGVTISVLCRYRSARWRNCTGRSAERSRRTGVAPRRTAFGWRPETKAGSLPVRGRTAGEAWL